VKWENSTNESVLAAARAEILKSTDGNRPPVFDPFCGGAIPSRRLGAGRASVQRPRRGLARYLAAGGGHRDTTEVTPRQGRSSRDTADIVGCDPPPFPALNPFLRSPLSRTFFSYSIAQLESLARDGHQPDALLRSIFQELAYRSTERAAHLRSEVAARLDGTWVEQPSLDFGTPLSAAPPGAAPTAPSSEPDTMPHDAPRADATQARPAPAAAPDASTTVALERTRQVFKFLKALALKNVPKPVALREYEWVQRLVDLPSFGTIFVGSVTVSHAAQPDATTQDADAPPLLRIARPKLTEPPKPPDALVEWIHGRWNDPSTELQLRDTLNRPGAAGQPPRTERLADIPERVRALDAWRGKWLAWAEAERPARAAMEVFDRFYELHGRIERESERVELMLGDGRLRHPFGRGADHPVLLQRVELEFDANVPEFRVVDSDRGPELYAWAIQEIQPEVSGQTLNALRNELEANAFHPLGDNGTAGYLESLANRLGATTRFLKPGEVAPPNVPTVARDQVLFLRPRVSGMPAALDRVLEDLEESGELPISLSRVVGVAPPMPDGDTSLPDISLWGEPPDVLFSKEANLEQVRIARTLERKKAVLVQGPPGTGKSHTIANLIGHLVASGKRVLVTSHTTKALRVLRNHVVEELRPLCVSLLDQDLEGRTQLEQAVRGIVGRLGSANEHVEAEKVEQLVRERQRLIDQVERLSDDLRKARGAEYEPLLVGNEHVLPADAARTVKADREHHEWLPGPLLNGGPIPLSVEQLITLYESNGRVTPEEERELEADLPPLDQILDPDRVETEVAALNASEPESLTRFWERVPAESDLHGLGALAAQVESIAADAKEMAAWQRALAEAGRVGESERGLWLALRDLVRNAATAYERDRELLLTHDVQVLDEAALEAVPHAVAEMEAHAKDGGTFGGLQLLIHGAWKAVLRAVRVDGQPPSAPAHFATIRAMLEARSRRAALARRWDNQAVPIGLPRFASIGEPPERLLLDYVGQFERWLGWWDAGWLSLEPALRAAGFRWSAFREYHVARNAPISAFERDLDLVTGPLHEAVGTRLPMVRRALAERLLQECARALAGRPGRIAVALRRAVDARDVVLYRKTYDALLALTYKAQAWSERRRLLGLQESCAPGWASAIRLRQGIHGGTRVPDDVPGAWLWRQLEQELERRANLDERDITRKLGEARAALRRTTIELIDASAWLAQLRRTDLKARMALIGWSDTQKRIGKGTGKRVPELQARARELLSTARDAVPVWIMPLARVAESFDPRGRKFDVVIVDEASQSDVTALLAFYLGESIVVVGDHEQVSPSAVGERVEEVQALRTQYLVGVPNQHLYDGRLSIYDLARQAFEGTIALREHFRCVPDIIDFSNFLSYDGQILPLRDPATANRPHVVEHVVPVCFGGRGDGKTNEGEARNAAAILAAMFEMEEYRKRSIGVISLLGDEQAQLVESRVLPLVGAVALESHRFAAGNAAQFQGDERDVILLSMVDSSSDGMLRMRSDEPTKQRYNVAASRARDQLWLLHSLDVERHLQPGDLRRQLIEHVRDPGGRRRALSQATARAESPFEREVIERLIGRGYQVEPQVQVGHYRLDMVVSCGDQRVALECDGDRWHPLEKLPEDLARQAVLERTGWRFVRLRGTRFFRDTEGTMAQAFDDLARLGVHPNGPTPSALPQSNAQDVALREEVLRRAWRIMLERGWVSETAPETVESGVIA
jgi:very-short-patch-repair endonuclease